MADPVSDEQNPSVTPKSLIKEEHVKSALEADKGRNAELVSWEVVDFTNKGDNYACIVTSVVATYCQGGQEQSITYIVKCNPCRANAALNSFIKVVFKKEAVFYQQIMPQLNTELESAGQQRLRLATCYYTHLVDGEEIIMLKDLRPEGFKMFDRRKGMDKIHTSLVLKELGRFHSSSVLLQAKVSEYLDEKYPILQKDFTTFTDDSEEMFKNMFTSYCNTTAELVEKCGGYDHVAAWLRKSASTIHESFESLIKKASPFEILCHGDCWNNNILFKYDESGVPVDVRLLDLQLCRQASPATDLNYLLYTSLNGAERKENLENFLQTYFDSFCSVLERVGTKIPFTRQELRKEYHDKNKFGLLMGLMIVPMVVSEASEVIDLDAISDDNMETMMEEYRENTLKQLDNNPLLRPRLLSMFDDMIEYGIIS